MAVQLDKDRPVAELEKERAWWWVAEKKRSKRLDYLRKAIYKKGLIGGTYSPGLMADLETMQIDFEAEKEFIKTWPATLRRARVVEHVLDNIPIFITDHSQLVGYWGSAPSVGWSPSGAAASLYTQPNIIPEPQEESLKALAEMGDWFNQHGHERAFYDVFDPEDLMKFISGAIAWGSPSAEGYSNKNYEYWMGRLGFEDILAQIE